MTELLQYIFDIKSFLASMYGSFLVTDIIIKVFKLWIRIKIEQMRYALN